MAGKSPHYAMPRLGRKRIDEITTSDVIAVLLPIWTAKAETARPRFPSTPDEAGDLGDRGSLPAKAGRPPPQGGTGGRFRGRPPGLA